MNITMKLLVCLLYSSLMYGASVEVMPSYKIIHIDSISRAIESIKSYAGEESLYLVDLDDNAFIPVDPYLRNANSDARCDLMKKLKLDPESLYWKTGLHLRQKAEWQLMDGVWPELICDLKKKGQLSMGALRVIEAHFLLMRRQRSLRIERHKV